MSKGHFWAMDRNQKLTFCMPRQLSLLDLQTNHLYQWNSKCKWGSERTSQRGTQLTCVCHLWLKNIAWLSTLIFHQAGESNRKQWGTLNCFNLAWFLVNFCLVITIMIGEKKMRKDWNHFELIHFNLHQVCLCKYRPIWKLLCIIIIPQQLNN